MGWRPRFFGRTEHRLIRSMTGFGAATAHDGSEACHVEIRSVNNRYFKASLRLAEALQPLEAEVELALRKRLARGSVTVRATLSESSASAAYEINDAALKTYVERVRAACPDAAEGTTGNITLDVAQLLSLPGVLLPPGDEDERLDRVRGMLLPLIDKACDELIAMRTREGEALATDLLGQQAFIAGRLKEIEARAPEVVQQYEERLKSRIEVLLKGSGVQVDQVDLIREIAAYAEKTDIAEEITRLDTHLEQFERRIKDGGDAVGRTLEFLGQEMLREANTIASKSPDAEVSRLAIEIKGAIDRIKEQVQNVE